MTAALHLRSAPDPAEILTAEIRAVCDQIDRRNGTPPGTAERAVYFWYWPPGDHSAEVLTRLHADAVAALAKLTDKEGKS